MLLQKLRNPLSQALSISHHSALNSRTKFLKTAWNYRQFSAMAGKKTLVVFGGTGGQGGSVVKTILKDSKMMEEWQIRAITRDVSKPAAKALEEKGVEVVSANMDDPGSLESALKDAYAAFVVTNYWETMSADVERKQGKNVANAAKKVGIQHLIFSSLLNINKISGGVFANVHHFDSKADIEDYIREIGVPATFYLPAVYMSNFTPQKSFRPSPQPPHAFTLALPGVPKDKKVIPLLWAEEDTGKFVKGILKNRESLLGKRVLAADRYYSTEEMVQIFSDVKPKAGNGAQAITLPPEVYRDVLMKTGMPEFAAVELSENFEMCAQCGYYGGADVEEFHSILDEPVTTWKEFISTAKDFADLE